MKIIASAGHPDIAMVYVMDFDGNLIECVEAVQPPLPDVRCRGILSGKVN